MKRLLLGCVFAASLTVSGSFAQAPAPACSNPGGDCPSATPVPANFNTSACSTKTNFSATPFLDSCPSGPQSCQRYGDPDNNYVSMYGSYGNIENSSQVASYVQAHYSLGANLAQNIKPLCQNGLPPTGGACAEGGVGKIVFLALGFSNCDIEMCGGNSDAWDGQDPNSPDLVNGHLPGLPCATQCQNFNSPIQSFAWNQVKGPTATKYVGDDGITQKSFLYQVYSPSTWLVGQDVVVFDGAYGALTLETWDPYDGFYNSNNQCTFDGMTSTDTECNYDRAKGLLVNNGFREAQVQAILFKSADGYPHCDLKGAGTADCAQGDLADAYIAEKHLSNIMQYLRCCELTSNGYQPVSRYPNLQQVFIVSRIYGGYGNDAYANTSYGGHTSQCLNPEPFAYEIAFGIQRLIVGQIDADGNVTDTDPYVNGTVQNGSVKYNSSPNVAGGAIWFDWAPYLWANGYNLSPGNNLAWCDSTTTNQPSCSNNQGDFRYGDLSNQNVCYGDHIHPSYQGQGKVAGRLVNWIRPDLNNGLGLGAAQGFISDWVTPWIGK